MTNELQEFYQISSIESNKQFQRLSEKTQVVMPQNGQHEVIKNRLTHSYEVATSSMMMAANIAHINNVSIADINYQGALFSCSLLHDIGHPSFGHDGAEYLDEYFSNLGVNDGFSDNNNNLVVIEKNNINVSDYVKASVIKYPNKLYPFQQKKYIPMLDKAILDDEKHYQKIGINLKNQTKTIACQIMDEADRNSYACSDLADFLCLGNTLSLSQIYRVAQKEKLYIHSDYLTSLVDLVRDGSKSSIKVYFNELKNKFNCNYNISESGLVVIDEDLENYREFLSKLCFEYFIFPIRKDNFHKENMVAFKQYVEDVVNGKYSPSEYYTDKISNAKNKIQKYTYMRDMIAEVSDWYILNYKNKMKQ